MSLVVKLRRGEGPFWGRLKWLARKALSFHLPVCGPTRPLFAFCYLLHVACREDAFDAGCRRHPLRPAARDDVALAHLDLAGEDPIKITSDPAGKTYIDNMDYAPAWSPDGQHISYTFDPDGASGGRRVDVGSDVADDDAAGRVDAELGAGVLDHARRRFAARAAVVRAVRAVTDHVERAEQLGGSLDVTSAAGKGTTVHAELPLPSE